MPNVSLAQANRIIDGALKEARRLELPRVCVSVLDSGGHLVALQREDGCTFLRARVSPAKAWGAVATGTDSRDISARYERATREEGFINGLNALTGGQIVPLPGGVLILDGDGVVCGAVGISGAASEDDERCAVAGIAAAGLRSHIEP
jgi:uncharacterized protein GlcG (DUF336 family)